MEGAETRCRCKPSGGFHRRPGRSREPMGPQPDTSTSAPEVWHGVLQILAPIFVARLLATYLASTRLRSGACATRTGWELLRSRAGSASGAPRSTAHWELHDDSGRHRRAD